MTRRSLVRPALLAAGLFIFGCGGVDAVPDGGGGSGGAAGASGRGGATGGQGGTAGAAGQGGSGGGTAGTGGQGGAAGSAGSGGAAGAGGAGGRGGSAGAGGSGGSAGAGGQGGAAGAAGSGGQGGAAGAAGRGGAGGTAGSAGSGGAAGAGGQGGAAGAAGRGGAGGTAGAAGGGGGSGGAAAGAGGGGTAGSGPAGSGGTGGAAGAGGQGGTGGAIAAPSISSTNFTVVAHGLDLAINGSGVGSATAVTIGGVAHTFTVSSNTQVRTRVLDTTPTGGQSIVVTNSGGSSLPFSITVIHLVINELDPDQASIDSGEFVEISAGVGSVSLADYSLVFWNGANETAYYAVDLLGSTNSAGLLTVGNAAVVSSTSLTFPDNTLQNGADAVALYAAPASSFPDGSLLTSTRLIDAVVYGSGDADDAELLNGLFGPTGTAGRVQVNEALNAMPTTQSILRCGTARLRGDRFVVGTPTANAANGVAACN